MPFNHYISINTVDRIKLQIETTKQLMDSLMSITEELCCLLPAQERMTSLYFYTQKKEVPTPQAGEQTWDCGAIPFSKAIPSSVSCTLHWVCLSSKSVHLSLTKTCVLSSGLARQVSVSAARLHLRMLEACIIDGTVWRSYFNLQQQMMWRESNQRLMKEQIPIVHSRYVCLHIPRWCLIRLPCKDGVSDLFYSKY